MVRVGIGVIQMLRLVTVGIVMIWLGLVSVGVLIHLVAMLRRMPRRRGTVLAPLVHGALIVVVVCR